jgi:hypothetical protein
MSFGFLSCILNNMQRRFSIFATIRSSFAAVCSQGWVRDHFKGGSQVLQFWRATTKNKLNDIEGSLEVKLPTIWTMDR